MDESSTVELRDRAKPPQGALAVVGLDRGYRIEIALLCLALVAAFWPLFERLPDLWFGADTYYAHGSVVPICAGLILWDRWPKIRETLWNGTWWLIVPLTFLGYVQVVAAGNSTRLLMSTLLLVVLLMATAFAVGWRVLRYTAVPTLYLAFALPFWDSAIDKYTQPLQHISSDLAFVMLKLAALRPYKVDPTTIMLQNFTLDVGIPCSGLKLVLAVVAIVTFFVAVAHLSWWRNVLLLASALPIAFLVNGLRIAMVGLVGNFAGSEAGHKFHDYSGYISLAVCFLILMKFTKLLGWK